MRGEECARLLLECGAIEIRTEREQWFTWASGKRAPIYCDNRLLISWPEARSAIADALTAATRERFPGVEVIAGAATGGIPHAAWVAERLELPMVYVRSSAKDHGRRRVVEGAPLSGERVVLIEDLISLGGSAAAAVEGLQSEGGKVIGVQAIVTWDFATAGRRLAELGVPWQALARYEDVISAMALDASARRRLLEWRDTFE